MKVTVFPGKAKGETAAPPSKSMSHRLLMAGALSQGSVIEGLAFSDDVEATLSCIKALGAAVTREGSTVCTGGLSGGTAAERPVINCRESGSTLRFLIPLCLTLGRPVKLAGSERLLSRPLGVYEDLCKKQRLIFERSTDGVTVCGGLKAGTFEIPGDVSSQFLTGLMFVLPLLPGDSVIKVPGRLESASYVRLTRKALSDFGVTVEEGGQNEFFIKGGQKYLPRRIRVEGDWSNAVFADSFNLLGGKVKVTGLSDGSVQGDRVYKTLFERIEKRDYPIDLSDCPDLAPMTFALAAAKGGGFFTGTARLKIKESDRAEAMREELSKFGVTVTVGENSVTVGGEGLKAPGSELCGHNDHRIVMALTVLCTLTGGKINGAQAVSKSYPGFFEMIAGLGIRIKVEE